MAFAAAVTAALALSGVREIANAAYDRCKALTWAAVRGASLRELR